LPAYPDFSPAATAYRRSQVEDDASMEFDRDDEGSELDITPALKAAFLKSLEDLDINLFFYSGPWHSLKDHLQTARVDFDLVLTSETIYQLDSLDSLIDLLDVASTRKGNSNDHPFCLVAAKVLYFGVGGGISEFTRRLRLRDGPVEGGKRRKGDANAVWEKNVGVGRRILRVDWTESGQ
jgi:protein-histidine N-methyltransferase